MIRVNQRLQHSALSVNVKEREPGIPRNCCEHARINTSTVPSQQIATGCAASIYSELQLLYQTFYVI